MAGEEDKRFYGIYEAICVDNVDKTHKNRIWIKIPQVSGSETTLARPCLPVTDNANHPDHVAHTAAKVADLLVNHTDVITTSSVNDGGTGSSSHSHTVTLNAAHAGNSKTLTHPHVTTVNTTNLWNDKFDVSTTTEHTPHRLVPNIGQKVWVMFIAGDPNFPIWMGVEQ